MKLDLKDENDDLCLTEMRSERWQSKRKLISHPHLIPFNSIKKL